MFWFFGGLKYTERERSREKERERMKKVYLMQNKVIMRTKTATILPAATA